MSKKNQLKLNENQILEAREWISDCQGSFIDIQSDEDVDSLSDDDVIQGIARWFDGGISGFIKTCED